MPPIFLVPQTERQVLVKHKSGAGRQGPKVVRRVSGETLDGGNLAALRMGWGGTEAHNSTASGSLTEIEVPPSPTARPVCPNVR